MGYKSPRKSLAPFSFEPGAGQSYGKADLVPVAGVRLSLAQPTFSQGFFFHQARVTGCCWRDQGTCNGGDPAQRDLYALH